MTDEGRANSSRRIGQNRPSGNHHCEDHGSGPWQSLFCVFQRYCHCEASQRPKQSRFCVLLFPFVLPSGTRDCHVASLLAMTWGKDAPWVSEIAASGQNTPFLAMTVGGTCELFTTYRARPPFWGSSLRGSR